MYPETVMAKLPSANFLRKVVESRASKVRKIQKKKIPAVKAIKTARQFRRQARAIIKMGGMKKRYKTVCENASQEPAATPPTKLASKIKNTCALGMTEL